MGSFVTGGQSGEEGQAFRAVGSESGATAWDSSLGEGAPRHLSPPSGSEGGDKQRPVCGFSGGS